MDKQLVNYNPYDLVPLLINGKPITGRPYEFDSQAVNQKKMTNAFGAYVKPTKVATVCPDCAQGLLIDVKLGEPPFSPFSTLCYLCRPAPPPLPDPFINPVKTGRVPAVELDPLLQELKPLDSVSEPVAARFHLDAIYAPEEPAKSPPVVPAPPKVHKPAKPPKAKKDDKKKEQKPQKANPPAPVPDLDLALPQEEPVADAFDLTKANKRGVPLEKADGMGGEEQDFDDRDLLEDLD